MREGFSFSRCAHSIDDASDRRVTGSQLLLLENLIGRYVRRLVDTLMNPLFDLIAQKLLALAL